MFKSGICWCPCCGCVTHYSGSHCDFCGSPVYGSCLCEKDSCLGKKRV